MSFISDLLGTTEAFFKIRGVPVSTGVNVRQTVLTGSVDSNGFPNCLAIGSGLSVNFNAATTNVIINFAYSFGINGAIDYIGTVSSNLTFSSLTANTTNFLYVDRDLTTGVLTLGFTTLAPVYQTIAPSSPSTGQHWFDLSTFTMKRWNGSAWVVFQRVFIGEALAGASTITSVNTYAYRGQYQSVWTAVVANTVYTFNHNLGIYLSAANANILVMTSTAGNDTDNIVGTPFVNVGGVNYGYQSWYASAGRTAFSITTKDLPIRNSSNTYVSTGYYKVCINRGL